MPNTKAKKFISKCKEAYGKDIPYNINAMELIVKSIDIKKVKGFSWVNSIKSWGICETEVAHNKETGSLRVLWYRSAKQYYQSIMGKDFDADKANSLLSTGLADLVRSGEYLYSDFAVEDAAYCADFRETIMPQLNGLMFCEKSSEFPKFKKSCEILGIKCLVQGSGRSNFSTTEYLYTNYFDGYIDTDHPLRALILSDFDYDGVLPIGEGFVKQLEHFAPNVVNARIGLSLDQISVKRRNVKDALYEVKQSAKNAPKDKWMEENLVKDKKTGKYLGAEVECNPFSYYYPLIWDALKETGITYDDFVEARYQKIQPDFTSVSQSVATELVKDELVEIEDQIDKLRNKRTALIKNKMEEIDHIVEEEGSKESYIYCQQAAPEKRIYNALRKQISWSGSLKIDTQFRKLVNIVLKRVNEE